MLKNFAKWLLVSAFLTGNMAHAAIPVYGYIVKNTYPHDPSAFTEGLFYKDDFLYESTGLAGHSSLRKVDLVSGKILQQKDLSPEFFGEGSTEIDGKIISLTWKSQVGFIFDAKTFNLKKRFTYTGEGWGLTSDTRHVYMSDGTPFIRILNPVTLKEERRIYVMADGIAVDRLNELEWVEGELFANIWGTDVIARIDPATGHVVGWINLKGLLPPGERISNSADAVLNGIAYDSKRHRLFVTGKLWPKLFEIDLLKIQN